ncbi:MAG: exosortase A [Burkholderiaceae bacterium]|nr:exosortase A [Burkholderiaceae bacterium]
MNHITSPTTLAAAPDQRRALVAMAVLLLALLLGLFRETALGMVHIWTVSTTFNHAFLVPPIVAWLVWRRRAELAAVPFRPAPWVLLPMALICLLWLLADLADVGAAAQFSLVLLLTLTVVAICGHAVARVIAFPLLFLFFAVPIGEFAVPTLQEWTADVTVAALRATGIPVYRDGNQFIIPSGVWSVIEACSGVRYLIACVMVGTLFAYLNYRSWKRRLIFIAMAVVVPILANWLRAYTIVMVGHVTGSPMILGVDHTVYGWYLFGVVVLVFFMVGARWAEDDGPERALPPGGQLPDRLPRHALAVAAGVLAMAVGVHAWAWHLEPSAPGSKPVVTLPDGQATSSASETSLPWAPGFVNPRAEFLRSYQAGGVDIQVWLAYYAVQGPDSKLVSSMNHVVDPADRRWAYHETGRTVTGPDVPGFRQGTVRQGGAPSLTETQRYRVWHAYWIGGKWTASPAQAKLWQALEMLLGRGDHGAVLVLSTLQSPDADATLAEFARTRLGGIAAALDAARHTSGLQASKNPRGNTP